MESDDEDTTWKFNETTGDLIGWRIGQPLPALQSVKSYLVEALSESVALNQE